MSEEENQLKLLSQLENKIDVCVRSVNWLISQIEALKKENTKESRKQLLQLKNRVMVEKKILDKYEEEFELICGS